MQHCCTLRKLLLSTVVRCTHPSCCVDVPTCLLLPFGNTPLICYLADFAAAVSAADPQVVLQLLRHLLTRSLSESRSWTAQQLVGCRPGGTRTLLDRALRSNKMFYCFMLLVYCFMLLTFQGRCSRVYVVKLLDYSCWCWPQDQQHEESSARHT
jgi:hypothetical protein